MSDHAAVPVNDSVPVDEEAASPVVEETLDIDVETAPATYVHQSSDDVTFVVMTAESVTFDLADSSPHLHLMEADIPYRNISIPIALVDAQALYNALHRSEEHTSELQS